MKGEREAPRVCVPKRAMAAAEGEVDVLDEILRRLDSGVAVDNSQSLAAELGVDHQTDVVRAIKTLEAAEYVLASKHASELLELTAEGEDYNRMLKPGESTDFGFCVAK